MSGEAKVTISIVFLIALVLITLIGSIVHSAQQNRDLFTQLVERGTDINVARCAAFNRCSN